MSVQCNEAELAEPRSTSRQGHPTATVARAAGPAALVLGPALTVAGFALHPLAADPAATFIARINSHPARWALAHLLIGVGLGAFAAGIGSVLRLAHGRGARFLVAGVLTAGTGAVGMGYEAIGHGAVGYALAGRADVPLLVSTHVQTAFEHLGFSAGPALVGVLFPLGLLLLGIGALRSRATPRWGAVLLLLAPFGIQVAGAGPWELLGAAPLVIGLATLARAARSAAEAP